MTKSSPTKPSAVSLERSWKVFGDSERVRGGLARLLVALPVLVVFVVIAQCTWASAEDDNEFHIAEMHNHPWFWEVLASSLVGWLLGIVKGFSGSEEWLQKYWTDPPKQAILVVDLLIFVGVGAYFGTGIYKPQGFLEAIAAGISWPVGLGALATKD